MIPIRDTIQSKNYPAVNTIIIAVNVLIYVAQMALQEKALARVIVKYGLVPIRYSAPEIASHFTFGEQLFPFVSFMFLHGGFWHLLGNMWSLYIFGDNVEDDLGSIRYLFFYLLCGSASGLSHLIINWHSQIPTIGASGAIAGVMGAYMLLYPKSRILTLIPIFFIPYFVQLPAFFFIGIWFVLQFISATGTTAGGGIAWWAHIGGFLFGIIFLKIFQSIPRLGLTRRVRDRTAKQRTPRLQVINTVGSAKDPHLYGSISITPREARMGTGKVVNIPRGFRKRLFKVGIPPGVSQGTTLRLSGMGRSIDDEKKGDLYLKVKILED